MLHFTIFLLIRIYGPLLTGNLTKHMKSKAHSKKCMEMGVPELLIEDQDAEDSGTVRHEREYMGGGKGESCSSSHGCS